MSKFWTCTCTLVSPDLAACRPSQQKHYPPSRRLLFHVLKGMPRLELSIAGLPTTAAAGELLRVQVGSAAGTFELGVFAKWTEVDCTLFTASCALTGQPGHNPAG
jgi:hypothetical protein